MVSCEETSTASTHAKNDACIAIEPEAFESKVD